ncbi:hypothetical protein Taro_041544 [Colocasia esculenta]|uniref:Uncharacterized protein n=1 Tax=Colocasia esculenta TaxID=4460 RepID=A0A843WLR1_COLES|nr:hypothetical protein [Colocasia esculenta]
MRREGQDPGRGGGRARAGRRRRGGETSQQRQGAPRAEETGRVTPRSRGREGAWGSTSQAALGQWGGTVAVGPQHHRGSSVGGLSINSARRATTAGHLWRSPSDGRMS